MTNQKKQIVVTGAGYAEMLATMRLAGKTRPNEVTIILFFYWPGKGRYTAAMRRIGQPAPV